MFISVSRSFSILRRFCVVRLQTCSVAYFRYTSAGVKCSISVVCNAVLLTGKQATVVLSQIHNYKDYGLYEFRSVEALTFFRLFTTFLRYCEVKLWNTNSLLEHDCVSISNICLKSSEPRSGVHSAPCVEHVRLKCLWCWWFLNYWKI